MHYNSKEQKHCFQWNITSKATNNN